MTAKYIKAKHGSAWSLIEDGELPAPGEVTICDITDPEYMTKVNDAVGEKVFSDERILEFKNALPIDRRQRI